MNYSVFYADTDAGNIVYHGRYIEMSDLARNMPMNVAEFTFSMLARQYQVMLTVRKAEAVYHTPTLQQQ